MAAKSVTFETGHEDMIHDVQLDYYGKRLATASSDRTIRVFDILPDGKQVQTALLKYHEGPVWQVSWAHPKFGTILASCSYDGRVCVWREQQANVWVKIYEDATECSVNSISWAPHSYGLILAAGSSDGTLAVYEHKENGQWEKRSVLAHQGGCCAVSWGPDIKTGALLSGEGGAASAASVRAPRRLVTGGCDNHVRIWSYEEGKLAEQKGIWKDANAHADWVRDVAWAPSIGLPSSTIASCSEDKTVAIWTETPDGQWKKAKVLDFPAKVWRVSWSVMGNILAVSQGDNKVTLWKESVDGDWKQVL